MKNNEELARLLEELEDIKAERQYQLGQTGVHISAKKVISLREYYDQQIEELEIKIRTLSDDC
ncbi:MAG TPA: hypothetical protein VNU93_08470 [Verrucomicrobiae bacterium]|nr:hypothetical protein [Verrucomicrobiae bacterium]